MATHSYHEPVLLTETLGQLDLAPGSVVIDGTLGGGGHAEAILETTAPDGLLIGLDLDADAIHETARRLEAFGDRVNLVQASFRSIDDVAEDLRGTIGDFGVDGVVLDLGVSSFQLDEASRGFRFGPGEE